MEANANSVRKMNQSASFIKRRLAKGTPIEREFVFTEIIASAYTLMLHPYGSLIIRDFWKIGTTAQQGTLSKSIFCNVIPLTLHQYGSKVMMAAVEAQMPPEFKLKIAKELEGRMCECARDQYGNLVIGKLIDAVKVDEANLHTITRELKAELLSLTKHKYGNFVVTRMLAGGLWEVVLAALKGHMVECAKDEYGNYVLRTALDSVPPTETKRIIVELKRELASVSMDKHGSHLIQYVVERAFEPLTEINELLDDHIIVCAEDQYGNYVLQKCLDCTDPQIVSATVKKFKDHIYSLSLHPYGSRLIHAIVEKSGDAWMEVGKVVKEHFLEFALDQHGCHIVQAFFQRVNEFDPDAEKPTDLSTLFNYNWLELSKSKYGSYVIESLFRFHPGHCLFFANEVNGSVLDCAKDTHGTFIIRKCIENLDANGSNFIWSDVKDHLFELATDKNGIVVLQCLLEKKADMWKDILYALAGRVVECAKDPYASHGLQKLIRYCDPEGRQLIIDRITCTGRVVDLCTNRYGCYIIEDILMCCPYDQRRLIVEKIVENAEDLVQHQYGNYVIQQLLKCGRPEDRSNIVDKIRGKLVSICRSKFASAAMIKSICHLGKEDVRVLVDEVRKLHGDGTCNMLEQPGLYHFVQKIREHDKKRVNRNRNMA